MMRAIVCDLGGVVIRIDASRTHETWATLAGTSVDAARALFPGPAYEALERDELTIDAYLEHVRTGLGADVAGDVLLAAFTDIYLGADHGTLGVLDDLRERAEVIVALTNTNRAHHAVWAQRYGAELSVFDTVHCSHDLGARKPEQAAFRQVLAAHDIAPDETVFIDDVRPYVDAARGLGLHGIHFTTAAHLRADLVSLDWPYP